VDQWINIGASTLATIACLVFIASYHAKAPWWRSDIGRNLMSFAAAVGLFCTYTVLVSLWPDGCFAVVMRGVRTVAVLAIATLMVQRTRLLLQAQREPSGD
jgi:cell division protein FtsW (lipid II flippase)